MRQREGLVWILTTSWRQQTWDQDFTFRALSLHAPPRGSQLHPLAHTLLEHLEPSFHPCRVSGRPLPHRDPFLLLWRGSHRKWSLPHHENTQFSRDLALAPRWTGSLSPFSARRGNLPHRPVSTAPGLSFLQSVTVLPVSLSLRHHSVDILLAKTPNICLMLGKVACPPISCPHAGGVSFFRSLSPRLTTCSSSLFLSLLPL